MTLRSVKKNTAPVARINQDGHSYDSLIIKKEQEDITDRWRGQIKIAHQGTLVFVFVEELKELFVGEPKELFVGEPNGLLILGSMPGLPDSWEAIDAEILPCDENSVPTSRESYFFKEIFKNMQ